MEVFDDHRAAESVQPSIIGGMKTASRFAVLGFALTLGGHETTPPRDTVARADTVLREYDGYDDPSTLAPGTSLIGRRLRVKVDDTRELTVRVFRMGGEVQLDVDGKRYGIKGIPGVRVGDAIDAIDIMDGEVRIVAAEYGTADVARAEIERVLRTLSDADSSSVIAEVNSRVTAKPGTLLAATLAIKRMLDGWREGDSERFDVGFVRRDPQTEVLAMSEPGR